jgi:hypothetical protein
MYLAGYSTSKISQALSKLGYGFTRNAVIGRISRKGWNKRADKPLERQLTEKAPRPERKINLNKMSQPLPVPTEEPEEVGPLHIEIYDLNSTTCRWPFGERAPYTYCGQCPDVGSVYCYEHDLRSRRN